MRTTVDLSPDLIRLAKEFAHARGETLSSVLESAMREALARHAQAPAAQPLLLPVSGDPAAAPLVDILDKDALAEALEADAT